MNDENLGNESNQEQPQITDSDIMQAFKELKKTTVPKSQYDDLKKQNKDLMECIVDGTMPEGYDPNAKPVDIDEIRKNLFGKECSNLEYAKNALALRDALIKQGKPDPFLPQGTHIVPTTEDMVAAEKVAQALQHCIEYADGDSEVFTNELMRLTVDTRIPIRR